MPTHSPPKPDSLAIPVGSFAVTVAGCVYHTDPAVLVAHRLADAPVSAPGLAAAPRGLAPRYSLRKGLGFWQLTFEGRDAQFKHERGVLYVAWLLLHPPPQPIHCLDLAAKIPEVYRRQLGLGRLTHLATGAAVTLASDARLQQRNLSLDDSQALRALLRKEKELEAILDRDDEPEPVKEEALRELEAIAEFQRRQSGRSQDEAQRVVHAVRQAIGRFYHRLLAAVDRNGRPHPVLRPFAVHLERCLLTPSARYAAGAGRRALGPAAGCLTYQPPPDVVWAE